jgi:energy-converting hydrogenase Eha subunit C
VSARQNKFAIAQSGAIQPLVAMLYSDVREAQVCCTPVAALHQNTPARLRL